MRDTVYIGKKPVMSYIVATMTCLNENDGKAILKARGRTISNLVDVVEVLKRKFLPDIKVELAIGTEAIEQEPGQFRNVSTMEIVLTK